MKIMNLIVDSISVMIRNLTNIKNRIYVIYIVKNVVKKLVLNKKNPLTINKQLITLRIFHALKLIKNNWIKL